MPVIPLHFDERTDLYLQILREAQMVEDRRLARMVVDRLRQRPRPRRRAPDRAGGGRVIPFPSTPAAVPPDIPAPSLMWPRNELAQAAACLAGYLLLLTAYPLFS